MEPKSKRAASLKDELAKAARKITDLEREESALGQERIRLQVLAAQVGQLEAMEGPLRSEGEELRKKLDLLSSSHQVARCPLCDTSLGEDDCQRLAHNYELQIREKRDQYRSNQERPEGDESPTRTAIGSSAGKGSGSAAQTAASPAPGYHAGARPR